MRRFNEFEAALSEKQKHARECSASADPILVPALESVDFSSRIAIPKYGIYTQFLRMTNLFVSTGHKIEEEDWLLGRNKHDEPEFQAIEAAAKSFALQTVELDHRAFSVRNEFRDSCKLITQRG